MGKIVAYAMFANVFFLGLEFFTAFYSGIPGHAQSFLYLYTGLEGHTELVPLMWVSTIFAVGLARSCSGSRRCGRTRGLLALACIMLFVSLWIDKGFGLIIGGFVPNPFEEVHPYWPTMPEAMITIGVWAIGFLVLTLLYKIAITVREETAGIEIEH